MAAKYAIALREAREALYWLKLLSTDPLIGDSLSALITEADEWVAMLTTNRRNVFVASGMGAQLAAVAFRRG